MTQHSNTPSKDTPQLAPAGHTRIMPMAKYLGIHHQTLRSWIKHKRIPQPKVVNGIKLFDNTEILEWLEQQQAAADQVKGA